MFDWACGYQKFLERKQATLEMEEAQREQFSRKLVRLKELKLALDEAYDRWEGLEILREERQ